MSTVKEIEAAVRKLSGKELSRFNKWFQGFQSRTEGRPSRRAAGKLPPVEIYSNRRVAEFLLSNSIDAEDYTRAKEEVRKIGLDPAKIPHQKPPGAR